MHWIKGFVGKFRCAFGRHLPQTETVLAIARHRATQRRRLVQEQITVCGRCGVVLEGVSPPGLVTVLRARNRG